MAYTPSIDDIQEIEQPNQNVPHRTISGNSAAYTPSLADIQDQEQSTALANTVPQHSTLANFGLGALGATRNLLQDVADLPPSIAPSIFPRGQLPAVPQGQGIAYGAGEIAGNVAPFLAGGAALDAGRAALAARNLPLVSQAADWLGGSKLLPTLTRQAMGNFSWGALTNPQDRTMGAVKGATIGAPLSALPFAPAAISKFSAMVKPQPLADQISSQISELGNTQPLVDQIKDQLSNGGNSLEDSGKSLAQNIQNTYANKVADIGSRFNTVLDQVGDNILYPSTSIWSTKAPAGLYQNLPDETKSIFAGDIKKLDKAFSSNPTFENANELQKQLGSEIGALQYRQRISGLDTNQANQLSAYAEARNALKNDMNSFLENNRPDLQNVWNNSIDRWRDEIIPYHVDQNIKDMAQGNLTNPTLSNIVSAFKNPEPEMQQIVNELPDSARNSILYAKLGTTTAQKSADNLIKSFQQLDQQGLGSYAPQSLADQINKLNLSSQIQNNFKHALKTGDPEDLIEASDNLIKSGKGELIPQTLHDQLAALKNKIGGNKVLNAVTGGGIGYGIGHALGIPLSPELLALAGGFIGNKLLPSIYSSPILQLLGRGIAKGTGAAYQPIATGLRANLIPGQQTNIGSQ